ncbi:translation elongation factor Ts [Candidatus Peregrinibacteria bacterium CG10_big_fil_rev_8_21_14_0_10_36_19]|nr:MAG: translation elongation factor Ts [Candidatus Peregrinibacteria bacterium CG10_big_fil_rev_8_21_14_0_10_36_19]
MAVSIEQIKELREATGVSMMACKAALEESNGDYDAAVDILRKKGAAKAADRADRVTSFGVVFIKSKDGVSAMVQLNCETDFVALSDDFMSVAEEVADKLLAGEISVDDKELDMIKDAGYRLGENVQIAKMAIYNNESVGDYVHSNGKIGVLVGIKGGNADLAKDIAMHIAATNPHFIAPEEVSDELVAREKAIWAEQLAQEGKPAEMVEKIMIGKEKKFREESALLKQAFVKNPDLTIEQLLASSDAVIESFSRFAI